MKHLCWSLPSLATRAGRRNSEAKRGIQRETQTHENDVRRVKSPTKKGLANHDQGQKKGLLGHVQNKKMG